MIEIRGVNIDGVAACVPDNTVDNLKFGEKLFGKDIKKAIKATGVKERRVCEKSESTSLDLCIRAAEELFKDGLFNKEDIGGVVFVTSTPEYVMPNNATLAQSKLGLPQNIPAYDINLACSGYPYGLWNAAMLVNATDKKILLLDGDKQSHFVSPYDRATSLLFSDGGSATILGKSSNPELKWCFSFETDGSRHDAIVIPHGGSKYWIQEDSLQYQEKEGGSKIRKSDITMDGIGVFEFAVRDVPKNLRKFIGEIGLETEKIDLLALHQANEFIVKQIAKSLKFELEKTPRTIGKYGNTSSSSIPIMICDQFKGEISKKILMSGFGAGLSIGSAYLEVENTKCLGVVEEIF